jgi:hypothetical protein
MTSSRRNFTHWFLLIAIAFSPAYTATPTLGAELEEIIVTARKRTESLQDGIHRESDRKCRHAATG